MLSVGDLFSSEFSQYDQAELWSALSHYYCCDENELIQQLLDQIPNEAPSSQASSLAKTWIKTLRKEPSDPFSVNELMSKFGLNSDEGLALLSLAEALLRIPDAGTAEELIRDKIETLELHNFLPENQQSSWLDLSTVWGLAISQQLISSDKKPESLIHSLWERLGKSTTLKALKYTLNSLGGQFVFAEDIQQALEQRCDYPPESSPFSFDMLGEAAICAEDVDFYFNAYLEAIQAAGEQNQQNNTSISIKLSALHPRLENTKLEDVQKGLMHRLLQLLVTARNLDIAITIDAEESDRLELSLLIFEQLIRSELCLGWGKLGLAVQAYNKRALPVLAWLEALAQDTDTSIPVRLVKGAYWDSEIKYAQQQGLEGYPVYTQKAATDLSYLVCSRFLLSPQSVLLQPQFATHNALTIAYILNQKSKKCFEFQRLHGMGEKLYAEVQKNYKIPCRIYAPIGSQQTLLPYLVRRLLENGANSSFLFKLHDPSIPVDQLSSLPCTQLKKATSSASIKLPKDVFQPIRENSSGTNLGSILCLQSWQSALTSNNHKQWYCQPVIDGEICEGDELTQTYSPYKLDQAIGYRSFCSSEQIKKAISSADNFLPVWRAEPLTKRVQLLRNYAAQLEKHKDELVNLCVKEAGKCLTDAFDEIREAIDFCYYYANQAEETLTPQKLVSVTGEENRLFYQGKGVFLCISPWNFPLAIFTGQIAAALVCGNTVLAKPSSYCSLIAYRAVELWYEAGLPPFALQFVPFQGSSLSSAVLNDSRTQGVTFTGSTSTATKINRALANRHGGPIATLIAETGGQNAMIADSTTLPEQLVMDCIRSAFNSAGQRCSALRVLYVQDEIADLVEHKLIGAMNELAVGSTEDIGTDIGPVISKSAMDNLYQHIERQRVKNRIIHELELDDFHNNGYFVPPTLIRLPSLDELHDECFGPVLHLIRFDRNNLERMISEINRTGFGLTLGIHSRNDHFIEQICSQVDVGNIYINRDQVGAVVASQPFGGFGLSGTGPKAGGPNYLKRFVREQTITRNTTASGGNRELLTRKW